MKSRSNSFTIKRMVIFKKGWTGRAGILAIGWAGLAGSSSRAAEDVYTIVVRKQEQKVQKRWTIADILETNKKIRLMDMWLALHSPSPFEFYLSGDYRSVTENGSAFGGWSGSLGAYASIAGLEFQYEKIRAARWAALFHLRVFGYHDQGPNLTLEAGLRESGDLGTPQRNAIAGGKMALYFNRYFGIEGLYRHYFDPAAGRRLEGGAFIDFRFVRVTGTYFSESSPVSRAGISAGAKIYF